MNNMEAILGGLFYNCMHMLSRAQIQVWKWATFAQIMYRKLVPVAHTGVFAPHLLRAERNTAGGNDCYNYYLQSTTHHPPLLLFNVTPSVVRVMAARMTFPDAFEHNLELSGAAFDFHVPGNVIDKTFVAYYLAKNCPTYTLQTPFKYKIHLVYCGAAIDNSSTPHMCGGIGDITELVVDDTKTLMFTRNNMVVDDAPANKVNGEEVNEDDYEADSEVTNEAYKEEDDGEEASHPTPIQDIVLKKEKNAGNSSSYIAPPLSVDVGGDTMLSDGDSMSE